MSTSSTYITLDIKKGRIRIHKPTYHLLGDPKLIQLMFNPEDLVLAIRYADKEVPGGQEIRISKTAIKTGNDIELYSKSLLKKICKLCPQIVGDYSYRLNGTIYPEKRIMYFRMSTLHRFTTE